MEEIKKDIRLPMMTWVVLQQNVIRDDRDYWKKDFKMIGAFDLF